MPKLKQCPRPVGIWIEYNSGDTANIFFKQPWRTTAKGFGWVTNVVEWQKSWKKDVHDWEYLWSA